MLEAIGKKAKLATKDILHFDTIIKNELLQKIADSLLCHQDEIMLANKKDLINATEKNLSKALVDRLLLDKDRIESMANGLRMISKLPDFIGTISETNTRPNGLRIAKKIVPLGVIGIIYEARPNVTIDVFGLAFKSSNVVILRGGKEAIHSNMILVDIVRSVFFLNNYNPDIIQLVTDTTRSSAIALMNMNQYLDVLIPRGGASLIQAVVNESTVPIIETGTGNCHVYVDKDADIPMALDIVYNAKVRRPAVCNACETVVVHKDVKEVFLSELATRFKDLVEIRGDKETLKVIKEATLATFDDYNTEFLDYIIVIKVVNSLEEALNHIDQFTTKHSEAIVTNNEQTAQTFLNVIDAAAVYVNASTAFTDGAEFGLGAEVGISTQKLHARGPMGLKELTTIKYIITGNGQVRP